MKVTVWRRFAGPYFSLINTTESLKRVGGQTPMTVAGCPDRIEPRSDDWSGCCRSRLSASLDVQLEACRVCIKGKEIFIVNLVHFRFIRKACLGRRSIYRHGK